MFFRNASALLFVKFLWLGLIFGVISIVLKTIAKIFRKNVFIVNILTAVFWFCLTIIFMAMCIRFNNYAFSGVGLFGVLTGIAIIKISIDFFFDYFIRFIYNEFILHKRKKENGKLQTDKKV